MQKPSETVSKAAVQPGQEFVEDVNGGECGLDYDKEGHAPPVKVPMPGPIPGPIPPPPPEPKPGWQTTEFWVNIFVQIVSILTITGAITTDEGEKWQQVASLLGGLIASTISAVIYTKSRTQLKEPPCL